LPRQEQERRSLGARAAVDVFGASASCCTVMVSRIV